MSNTTINDFFDNLFEISLAGSVSLQPRAAFDEVPQDGMFTVDELGDYVPAEDPTSVNDPYYEEDGGDITIKTLI